MMKVTKPQACIVVFGEVAPEQVSKLVEKTSLPHTTSRTYLACVHLLSSEVTPVTKARASLHIDAEQFTASYGTERLNLTPTEFRLLAYLNDAAGRAVSRDTLSEIAVLGRRAKARAVDVHVKNLRQKLCNVGAPGLIVTVRGVGYRLAEQALYA